MELEEFCHIFPPPCLRTPCLHPCPRPPPPAAPASALLPSSPTPPSPPLPIIPNRRTKLQENIITQRHDTNDYEDH